MTTNADTIGYLIGYCSVIIFYLYIALSITRSLRRIAKSSEARLLCYQVEKFERSRHEKQVD